MTAPGNTELNYPGPGTQLPHCLKGKAILPNLPWDLCSFMSPVSQTPASCDSVIHILLFSRKQNPPSSLPWGSFPAGAKQLVALLSEFLSHFSKIICALVWCLSQATHFLKAHTAPFNFVCCYKFSFPNFYFLTLHFTFGSPIGSFYSFSKYQVITMDKALFLVLVKQ